MSRAKETRSLVADSPPKARLRPRMAESASRFEGMYTNANRFFISTRSTWARPAHVATGHSKPAIYFIQTGRWREGLPHFRR